jgi:hypothetical protein
VIGFIRGYYHSSAKEAWNMGRARKKHKTFLCLLWLFSIGCGAAR